MAPDTHFSTENYGDHSQKQSRGTGVEMKTVTVVVARATKFVPSVQALTNKHWTEIFSAVHEHLEAKPKTKRRRGVSALSRMTESEDMSIEREEFDYTFGSDI